MSKIQPHQIDFKDVTFIYQKIMDKDEQNWSIYLDDSYSLLSRELAGCCIADEQLFTISAGFSLYYKLMKSKMTIKNAEENLLISYNEINIDDKWSLMPLFFSHTMRSEKSMYLKEKVLRNIAFKGFCKLIKKDGLSIADLKRDYKKYGDAKYAHLLPLKPYLDNVKSTKVSSSKFESKEPRIFFIQRIFFNITNLKWEDYIILIIIGLIIIGFSNYLFI